MDTEDYNDNDGLVNCENLSQKQLLTFRLAELLGVKLSLPSLNELSSFDIVLSWADVHFLTRFLIPTGGKDMAEKRRNAVNMLPQSLKGIVAVLVVGRSEKDLEKLSIRLKRKRAVVVFLTHDWPAGVKGQQEYYDSYDSSRSRPIGNPYARSC